MRKLTLGPLAKCQRWPCMVSVKNLNWHSRVAGVTRLRTVHLICWKPFLSTQNIWSK